ncbi:hypothetical protein BKA82DRAFT_25254 [Pisolithus tinctorius]|uniref:Uncharacterized protein n=1 Tax=Pisolithus tinctorius Marx 270 TaxID=870435 RepID=A0A0C3J918_PISTI|nr:hypothetical protein BKA82DRAFT_25254 [Pisolithus tinctorius]KIO05538.1 hypothetical protein M404DRAFT_25254 [Pisolithus tinctorius Marx 270]
MTPLFIREPRGNLLPLRGSVSASSVVKKVMFELSAEVPQEALGQTLREQLDSWALARGHGGSSSQVPSHASPQSSPGLSPPHQVRTNPPNSAQGRGAQIEATDSSSRSIKHPMP